MRCVVLGGAGFIGSHLAPRLLEAGHRVVVFDRPGRTAPRGFPHAGRIEWREGDFLDRRDLARAIEGCEAAFHLVSTTLPATANADPAYDLETNVAGTLRMLEAARAAGLARIVFVSSGGTVYGVPRAIPIPETHPTDPITAYGIGKLAIEKYLGLYGVLHGLDYRILRLANLFGERQRASATQGVVAAFLERALCGRPIEVWGDGSAVRDYLYAGDAAEALVRALEHAGPERVINVGSGTGRSVNEIIAAIERVLGRRLERRYLPPRAFDVPANVLDISLARSALGWAPRTSFEEALARAAAWLREALDR
ncbi:MAG TPA: NAD-dependent epimerase/dehydratase family protein [Burkholderiales bacterium]|nr:NAD-dependent epimerase/dehydratase family protein [Burkholderiales bacterium]